MGHDVLLLTECRSQVCFDSMRDDRNCGLDFGIFGFNGLAGLTGWKQHVKIATYFVDCSVHIDSVVRELFQLGKIFGAENQNCRI